MRYPKQPVTIKIGNLFTVKAQAHVPAGDHYDYVTIPKATVLKLLRSGSVRVVCDGIYTDDYASDAAYDFQRGDVPVDGVLKSFDPECGGWGYDHLTAYYRAAWVDVNGKQRPASIHFHRYMNEDYQLLPLKGEITVMPR